MRKQRKAEQPDDESGQIDDDEPVPERSKKKKKRKKKRQLLPEDDERETPVWIWWAACGGGIAATLLALLVVAMVADSESQLRFNALLLLISLPISTVIFFVAMILSNLIAGAGEIGEIHVTVAKTFALVLVVNVIGLIPFAGPWIALLVWIGGVLSFFKLDAFEAVIVIVINWGLNFVVRLVLLGMMARAMQG
jgi:hypothetical protein